MTSCGALDYFQYAEVKWDQRMQAAIDILLDKRNKNGTWNVQAAHPGQVHFTMEKRVLQVDGIHFVLTSFEAF